MIIIGYNDPVTITVARLHLDLARQALEQDRVRKTAAKAAAERTDSPRKRQRAEELERGIEAADCALEAIVGAIAKFDAARTPEVFE